MTIRVLLTLCFLAGFAPAAEVIPTFGGERIEILPDSGDTIATGPGTLRLGDATLTFARGGRSNSRTLQGEVEGDVVLARGPDRIRADRLTFDGRTQQIVASGRIVATYNSIAFPLRLLSESLEYNIGTGAFRSGPARFGRFPYYAEGRSAEGTFENFVVQDATITLGEPGPLTPTTTARQLVYERGILRADGARIGIGRTLGIRVPQFRRSFDQRALPFLALSAGYRGSLGAFVDTSAHLPVGRNLQLGADLGYYTNRGLMAGPSGQYAAADPVTLNGSFRSGTINDHGDKALDVLGNPVPSHRSFLEWHHRQLIDDNLQIAAEVNYWKDSEILRDFHPEAFFPVQQPDTFASATLRTDNTLFSVFSRFQPNRFHRVQERLPELAVDLLPRRLAWGVHHQGRASAVRLREDPVGAVGAALGSDRLDAYYELRRPWSRADWLTVTPVLGGRVTRYGNTIGAAVPGGTTRLLGEAGVDAELRFTGLFDYRNAAWDIDGLRHQVVPRLSYRRIDGGDDGLSRIPRIDRRSFETYLPVLGLDRTRHLDDLGPVETLRLGLDQTVQTRSAGYGSQDLLTFNNAVDFRFARQPGELDVSEIHTEVSLTPAPWLRWDVYQSFAPRNFALRQINTGLTVRDGEVWSLRFANHYLAHQTEEYFVQATRRLTEAFAVEARVRYDARASRFNEQAVVLRQNLANTWDIEYAVALYDGPRRESRFGFRLRIDSLGF